MNKNTETGGENKLDFDFLLFLFLYFFFFILLRAVVAQWLERWTHDGKLAGNVF